MDVVIGGREDDLPDDDPHAAERVVGGVGVERVRGRDVGEYRVEDRVDDEWVPGLSHDTGIDPDLDRSRCHARRGAGAPARRVDGDRAAVRHVAALRAELDAFGGLGRLQLARERDLDLEVAGAVRRGENEGLLDRFEAEIVGLDEAAAVERDVIAGARRPHDAFERDRHAADRHARGRQACGALRATWAPTRG